MIDKTSENIFVEHLDVIFPTAEARQMLKLKHASRRQKVPFAWDPPDSEILVTAQRVMAQNDHKGPWY